MVRHECAEALGSIGSVSTLPVCVCVLNLGPFASEPIYLFAIILFFYDDIKRIWTAVTSLSSQFWVVI